MGKRLISKLKHEYLINQVKRAKLPDFPNTPSVCKSLTFSGKVQNVGFRFQVMLLAKRLKLNGWVKNLSNGDVELEVQGTLEKIQFLIDYMKSRRRMKIQSVVSHAQPLNYSYEGFYIAE